MFYLKFLAFVTLIIFLLEIIFRLILIIYGKSYDLFPKFNKKDFYIIDHPYLPFVLRANSHSHPRLLANYPLHKGEFFFQV